MNDAQNTVPGAYVPPTSRPAVSKDAPPISTKSPEPLQSHADVFQAQADREKAIRLKMTETGCTWPEAVKLVDGTPDAPDPLVARVASLEAAIQALTSSLSSANSSISALSSRVVALEAAASSASAPDATAPGTVQ